MYNISEKEWQKIQELVDSKNTIISYLEQRVEELEVYKSKDDLLFSYENENRELREKVKELEIDRDNTSKRLQVELSNVTALCEKITELSNKLEIKTILPKNVEMRSSDLIDTRGYDGKGKLVG